MSATRPLSSKKFDDTVQFTWYPSLSRRYNAITKTLFLQIFGYAAFIRQKVRWHSTIYMISIPMEEPFQPYSDSLHSYTWPYGGTISTIVGFFTILYLAPLEEPFQPCYANRLIGLLARSLASECNWSFVRTTCPSLPSICNSCPSCSLCSRIEWSGAYCFCSVYLSVCMSVHLLVCLLSTLTLAITKQP